MFVLRALLGMAVSVAATAATAADAPKATGGIKGAFVLNGDVPKLPAVNVVAGLAACAQPVPNEKLIVDQATKRMANVFIWAAKIDGHAIPPAPPSAKTVTIDNKNCRFEPHCLVAHSDQTLVLLNADVVGHNVHTFPIKGSAINDLIPPNERQGIRKPVGRAQILPVPVKCDIHPWMTGHMLVLDHPYAALSDQKGEFTIEGLPPGTYDLKVWHEAGGYVLGAKGISGVTVVAESVTDLDVIEIDVTKLRI